MKKLVSLLLSLIMLISLAPLAVAEEDVLTICFTDGWTGGPEALVPTDSPFMQEWMKQTGIQVKSVTLTNEQLAISPEKPDICMVHKTDSWLGSNVFEMISYGELISLNDLIDKGLCPNYMAALESTGDGLQCVSNDEGVIPGFFMLRAKDSPRSFSGMLIRQDWLDELGLEMPKTLADWDTVLRAFKEHKNAMFTGMYGQLYSLEYAFGVTDAFHREDTTVKFGPVQDNYKLFLEQFNTWYKEGILDPDVFTQPTDAAYAKIANGEIGAIFGFTGGTFNKIFSMGEDVRDAFVAAPVPVFSEENPTNVAFENPTATSEYAYVISADCENPELAAQFIDWIYSEEGIMLCNFGIEGITYEYDAEGKPYLTDFVKNNPKGYSANEAKAMYAGYQNKPQVITKDGMMIGMYDTDAQRACLAAWLDQDNNIRQLPNLTFTTEENDELSQIMGTISTYVAENRLNFIYGNRSLDEFEDFRSDIKNLGIERAVEIYQAAYNRFLAR